MSSQINILGKGNFLKQLKHPNRLESINILFSDTIIEWNEEVHNNLPNRVGVYAIIDEDNDIIYVGKATGVEGLKGRHRNHENNSLFKLYNAKEILFYVLIGDNMDDPGLAILLERIMIYGHEPILNNDFEHSTPKEIIIGDRILKELSHLIENYYVNGKVEDKQWLNHSYENLECILEVLKKSLEEYKEAIDNLYSKFIIKTKKKIVHENRKKLVEINKSLLKGLESFSRNP